MTDAIEKARENAGKWQFENNEHHAIARAQEGTTWAMIAIAEELRALRDVLKPTTIDVETSTSMTRDIAEAAQSQSRVSTGRFGVSMLGPNRDAARFETWHAAHDFRLSMEQFVPPGVLRPWYIFDYSESPPRAVTFGNPDYERGNDDDTDTR